MHLSIIYTQIGKYFSVNQAVKLEISQPSITRIYIYLVMLFIAGCKEREMTVEEQFFPGSCRILSYEPTNSSPYVDKLPVIFQYDNNGLLEGLTNPLLTEPSAQLRFDSKGRPVESSGEILFAGSEIVPFITYLYGDKGIKSIEEYSYYFDINGTTKPSKTLRKISRHIFEYGKSDQPESMELSYLEDSAGIEITSKLLKRYEYKYDSNRNLTKELCLENEKGQMILKNTTTHFYDNKVNSLAQLHFIAFQSYQSPPFMFSKNNLIHTKIEVGPTYSYTAEYDLKYDNEGQVTEDGKWFRSIKWECK
jgi:hypothetical protein